MEQLQTALMSFEVQSWLLLSAIAGIAVLALFRVRRRRRVSRFAREFDTQMRVEPEMRAVPDGLAEQEEGDVIAQLLAALAQGVDIADAAAQCGMTEDEARVAVSCYDPGRG